MEVAPLREGLAVAARYRRGLRGRFALVVACGLCLGVLAWGRTGSAQSPRQRPEPSSPAVTGPVPAMPSPPGPSMPAPQAQSGPNLPAPSGEPAADTTLAEKLSKPGDLTLRDTALSDALLTIGQTWNINVVYGDEVQGRVSGVFKQAPLREILDTILLSNGCSYRLVGQSLVVMKLKDVGDVNPLFQMATIPMRNTKPEELLAAVKLLNSPLGRAQVIPSAHSITVIDFPDRVEMIRNYVQKIDAAAGGDGQGRGADDGRLQAAYFQLQHVKPIALKDPITSLLSKEGKVTAMEGDSRIIVMDYGPQLELIRHAIEQLDVPRTQVRITALIYDLSNEDLERLGINWNSVARARNGNTSFTIDTVTAVPAAAGLPSGTITLMNLSRNFDLTSVIDLLQNCKSSRLLADPHVSVLDNEPAKIEIVTEIPYQQLTQTSQGGNIGTTAFREAGVKLVVTPRIANDNTIRMECNPIFSRLTGYTPGDNPQPIIDRREAITNVRVNNGQTFVIGGLRQRQDIFEYTGIPWFQDIKFLHLGALFRHKSTTKDESELVVFITPEIIGTDDAGKLREQAARDTGNCKLDEVPIGQGCGSDCNVNHDGSHEEIPKPQPQGTQPAAPMTTPAAPQPGSPPPAPQPQAAPTTQPVQRTASRPAQLANPPSAGPTSAPAGNTAPQPTGRQLIRPLPSTDNAPAVWR